MAEISICEAEKLYVLHGVQENLRVDGRGRREIRPMVFETDLVTHASGSAHLRLANTDVLVGIKAELAEPILPDRPDEGRLEFFVDCSANATPEFEGRGGEDLATEISRTLARAYQSPSVFDLTALGVLRGRQCWILYVDILILECGGGNLFDAVSIAVKAALYATRIPKVEVIGDGSNGKNEPELELSDDPYDGRRLDVSRCPVLITLSRIGNHCVVDPTPEEEACSSASLVMAVTPGGKITAVRKIGSGSFHPDTLVEAIELGKDLGVEINEVLMKKLCQEEGLGFKRKKIGFLQ